ncbi:MAG: hypothetical protein V3T83_15675 [Acidobacteriota bacterium]
MRKNCLLALTIVALPLAGSLPQSTTLLEERVERLETGSESLLERVERLEAGKLGVENRAIKARLDRLEGDNFTQFLSMGAWAGAGCAIAVIALTVFVLRLAWRVTALQKRSVSKAHLQGPAP